MRTITPAAFSATYRNSTPEELREVIRSFGLRHRPRSHLVQLLRDYPSLRTAAILENCGGAILLEIVRIILAYPELEMWDCLDEVHCNILYHAVASPTDLYRGWQLSHQLMSWEYQDLHRRLAERPQTAEVADRIAQVTSGLMAVYLGRATDVCRADLVRLASRGWRETLYWIRHQEILVLPSLGDVLLHGAARTPYRTYRLLDETHPEVARELAEMHPQSRGAARYLADQEARLDHSC